MEEEDFHTYYIAKTGVLVHNDGRCGHSGGKVRISSKSGGFYFLECLEIAFCRMRVTIYRAFSMQSGCANCNNEFSNTL